MKLCVAWLGMLFPALGVACEGGTWRRCELEFRNLVTYRTEAIGTAFGDLFGTLPSEIHIKFVTPKDPGYELYAAGAAYDPELKTLTFQHELTRMEAPNPPQALVYYWPYYQDNFNRRSFPVVEAIDNVLWGVYLQESAKARGLTWPHKDCESIEVGKRLPCEMLNSGVAEYVKRRTAPIFNENRLDRIWPEDFQAFCKRVWRMDPEYQDVQRYGGILLVGPLIKEFGVRRTLAYVAQTPFQVEQDDLRGSVQRYQERARKAMIW